MTTLADRVVLVTGAAGGIGRLLAMGCAHEGAHVIVADINEKGADLVAEEIRLMRRKAWSFRLDIADIASIKTLKQQVAEQVGRIDLLINNAGVVFGGQFETVPLERHLATYNINTSGLVALTYSFFDDLLQSRESHLVNIASASGFIGLPFGATYASSKWAVIGFYESIRLELIERGVKHFNVTTVCPSYINTGMFNGVKAPVMMPLLKPEEIVRHVLQAIKNNDSFVKEPFMVKHVELLRGLLPLKVFDVATKFLGVTRSMSNWHGH